MSIVVAFLLSIIFSFFTGIGNTIATETAVHAPPVDIPAIPQGAISTVNWIPIADSIDVIECGDGDDAVMGTAAVIGHGRILTVEHVIRDQKKCTFHGATFHKRDVIYKNSNIDMAIINVKTNDLKVAKYVCEPLVLNAKYTGIGFPAGFYTKSLGLPEITSVGQFPNIKYQLTQEEYADPAPVATILLGTGLYHDFPRTKDEMASDHLAVVLGYVRPGMSGGPVVNERGEIVGLIDALVGGEAGLIRELTDTPLCKGR